MKAVVFKREGEVAVETVPDPELRAPGDAVVKNRLAGICGSDLHVYHAREKGIAAGTVMGHEFVGEIVEAGPEARERGLAVGDLVVSPFTTSCGGCFYCRRGLTCRCSEGQLFGWVEEADGHGLEGAQAEYVRVPLAASTLVRVPEGVDEEVALFAGDILATGFYCAEMAEASSGGFYAVVGCGPVGLFAVVGARERGADEVLAIDVVPERLALAERFGAIAVDASRADCVAAVRERTEGRGADGVLEAVGSPEATRLAVDLVRPGGIVAAVGVHTEARFAFSPVEAYDKNLTYRAGRCPARRLLEPCLALAAAKRYDLAAVISHRLPLGEAAHGYEVFDRKLEACTKVLLSP